MIMRPYVDADMPSLQGAVSEWIARAGRCGYDHIGELPHRIYENRPRLVRLWESDGDIVGLAICGRFGNAFDLFTAPSLRGTAAEEQMFAAVPDEFVCTDVWDCDTVRIELLERLGFERFRVWDDVRERALDGQIAQVEGVRGARLADADALAEAHSSAFGSDWTGQTYRDQVMLKPGFDPAHEIVVEAPDGRIAAFTVIWIDERNRIGQPVADLAPL